MNVAHPNSRPPVPIGTTVYDAFPSLAALHDIDRNGFPDIREPFFWEIFGRYKRYTCLSVERFYNIFKAIEYIARSGIPGDIVECGVFLGGSILGAAHFADHFGLHDRRFFAFDTFEGFPVNTTEADIQGAVYDLSTLKVFNSNFRHIVEKNIVNSGIHPAKFVLVPGEVERTLRHENGISCAAFLRLDTDYFKSTLVELEILYPKLSAGGVLIVDDYGHFEGARRAVDEFFVRTGRGPLLQRIDYTARCGIKI